MLASHPDVSHWVVSSCGERGREASDEELALLQGLLQLGISPYSYCFRVFGNCAPLLTRGVMDDVDGLFESDPAAADPLLWYLASEPRNLEMLSGASSAPYYVELCPETLDQLRVLCVASAEFRSRVDPEVLSAAFESPGRGEVICRGGSIIESDLSFDDRVGRLLVLCDQVAQGETNPLAISELFAWIGMGTGQYTREVLEALEMGAANGADLVQWDVTTLLELKDDKNGFVARAATRLVDALWGMSDN